MKIGGYDLKVEKRPSLSGWHAAFISICALVIALLLFSVLFILAGVDPLEAYDGIISYAFLNPFGLPLTINRFIFLLLCTFAFIIPYRAGLWNIGTTGQLYMGALAVFGVLALLGARRNGEVAVPPLVLLPVLLVVAAAGGAIYAAIAGVLKGKYNINEIVVTMIMNFVAFWLVSFMIKEGGPFMGRGGEGESFQLPASLNAPLIAGIPFTILLAIALAVLLHFMFTRTRFGYQIRAFGQSPAAARYAGVNPVRLPVLVFALGGAMAGLAGYHYFAAVPGVYKITSNYGYYGDLAFYGIICGLIALGNPIASIPVALLFGGLSIGGRYIQGKLHMSFGVDYALLGVLMITLVGFQYFYRNQIVFKSTRKSTGKETLDAGVYSQES
ncbi:MAG: ABC transporter permease [Caldilineales bacterium]